MTRIALKKKPAENDERETLSGRVETEHEKQYGQSYELSVCIRPLNETDRGCSPEDRTSKGTRNQPSLPGLVFDLIFTVSDNTIHLTHVKT